MTKQDYIAIAQILKDHAPEAGTSEYIYSGKFSSLVAHLENYFASEDPRFDCVKFTNVIYAANL